MVFNSFLFFGFFAVTGLIFDLVKQKWRWLVLLAASLLFILFSAPKGMIFLLATCLITYFCTISIDRIYQNDSKKEGNKEPQKNKARIIISLDIVANLGILFATKYFNFFGEIVANIAHTQFSAISIILPLGISFYTFMMIGYAIDIYRKEYRVQTNFGKLFLFASYFPQLIDGPISRYNDVQGTLFNPPDIEYKRCRDGLMLFVWGLFKKLCIADNIAIYVNMIFGNYQDYHGLIVFSGAVAYAFYIYADFSGCIDMARGVSRYFGIELKDNFNHPYFAESVEEFWRRWHITLSLWFKDYLFYPVLRSKPISHISSKMRKSGHKKLNRILPTSIALLVVWLFTGLWHGARGTYVVWGLYYGVILIAANAISVFRKRKEKTGWNKAVSIFFTFIVICFGYIIFNSTTIASAFQMIRNVFSGPIISMAIIKKLGILFYKQVGATVYFTITVISFIAFILVDYLQYKGKNVYAWFFSRKKITKYICLALFVLLLLFMMNRTSGDFTYMQF